MTIDRFLYVFNFTNPLCRCWVPYRFFLWENNVLVFSTCVYSSWIPSIHSVCQKCEGHHAGFSETGVTIAMITYCNRRTRIRHPPTPHYPLYLQPPFHIATSSLCSNPPSYDPILPTNLRGFLCSFMSASINEMLDFSLVFMFSPKCYRQNDRRGMNSCSPDKKYSLHVYVMCDRITILCAIRIFSTVSINNRFLDITLCDTPTTGCFLQS